MPTNEEMRAFILKKGWKEEDTPSHWRWFLPALPAAHYRLEDAFELARTKKKEKR